MEAVELDRPARRCRRRRSLCALAALLALGSLGSPRLASAATAPTELTASVSEGELRYGHSLSVSGRLTDAGQGVEGVALALQGDPFPYRGFATLARMKSGPGGSFTFAGVRPDRNTQLRVVAESTPLASAPLGVVVDPAAALGSARLGPGQTRLSLSLRHAPDLRSPAVSAWWFVAARGSRVFRLAGVTFTRELAHGRTYAAATVDPPSPRFAFRVCLDPGWGPRWAAPPRAGAALTPAS